MNPSDYSSLTNAGALGLGVLFFGSATVILFYMYVGGLKEFATTLLKIATDQIISQNAQTRNNEVLSAAVGALTAQLKEMQDTVKQVHTLTELVKRLEDKIIELQRKT